MVGMSGLEPPTPTLSGKEPKHLGWKPYLNNILYIKAFRHIQKLLQQNHSNFVLQIVANIPFL